MNMPYCNELWMFYVFGLDVIQVDLWWMLFILRFHLKPKSLLKSNSAEKGLCILIFGLSVSYLCQVEGHGETLSKISLKIAKNFPRQIWKKVCFLISVCSPLSHGTWILDRHPSVKTLAFLGHCVADANLSSLEF